VITTKHALKNKALMLAALAGFWLLYSLQGLFGKFIAGISN